MTSGLYSVCYADVTEDSDGGTFETLKWGYDTAPQAQADLAAVAEEFGVEATELAVMLLIDLGGDPGFVG
jgi:hypothetical protein